MSLPLLRNTLRLQTVCYNCLRTPVARFSVHASLSGSTTEQKYDPGNLTDDNPAFDLEETSDGYAQIPQKTTRAEAYLASLNAAGVNPTLPDLEALRPAQLPHPDSKTYPDVFNGLVESLCRSFSKNQLRSFVQMYHIQCKSGVHLPKVYFAEAIIEKAWGWPLLKDVEKAKRDRTEVSVKSFPVTASELFLILGQDGVDLLQLSVEYKVHISLTSHPLSLRVEGLRGDLRKITERIYKIKRNIVKETIQLPVRQPIRRDLIQRISRLAGAYIENVGELGKLKVYAKDDRHLASAKRLVSRAAQELVVLSTIPHLSYSPYRGEVDGEVGNSLQDSYAMYPFLTPRALPWTMNTAGAFRIRKVGEWLAGHTTEDISQTGGLADGKGVISEFSGTTADIYHLVRATSPLPQARRTVKATLGHLLFTTTSSGQRATLTPPYQGHHQLPKITSWIQNHDIKSSFVTSLPSSFVDATPSKERILHRVDSLSPALKTLSLEVDIPQTTDHALNDSKDDTSESEVNPTPSDGSIKLSFKCFQGQQRITNLMLPDRPMDIQLAAVDTITVEDSSIPPGLKRYTDDLRAFLRKEATHVQPDPPLFVEDKGETYILHSSSSVRQSCEDSDPTRQSGLSDSGVQVTTESILDLENGQKTTQCQITCLDINSQEVWKNFLKGCDNLTATNRREKPSLYLHIR
ncbi:hypothetical protein C8Q75DRAFT_807802 [Abortiporus biennis]|nr:hypothetical protein C8Q75DRAFT_807802 [Abortiporus biennis]